MTFLCTSVLIYFSLHLKRTRSHVFELGMHKYEAVTARQKVIYVLVMIYFYLKTKSEFIKFTSFSSRNNNFTTSVQML